MAGSTDISLAVIADFEGIRLPRNGLDESTDGQPEWFRILLDNETAYDLYQQLKGAL
jgi:hypothetical protein